MSSLGRKTAGGRVRGAVARAFTPLESMERSAFYRLTLARLRSAVIKASARPELENSQDRAPQSRQRIALGFCRGGDRLDENASSNGNHAAVKLICESIRTRLRRNFAQRESGIALERIADARSIYEAHGAVTL